MIDTLTNIPSKKSLKKSLESAKFPILFLVDIKDFESTNVLHGDEAGNFILRSFADSLSGFAKNKGFSVFRVENDEFALLMDSSFDLEMVEKAIFDLLDFISHEEYRFKETTIKIETNIGISFDLSNSLEKAKLALTLAQKENQPFISYSQFATKLLEEKDSNISHEIEIAIKDNLITPYFQKVVDSDKNKIYDEVLIRLAIKNSIQPPKFFLEIAKKRGFYTIIVKLLSEKILEHKGTNAVNFSLEDLEDEKLFDYLVDRYKNTNTIFELHEDGKMEIKHLQDRLKKLKDANINICLDNIKSPEILKNFQNNIIDFVKVDGDLIRLLGISKEASDRCQEILNECTKLECKSIATHINSQSSFEECKKMRFDYFQGFFLSKPSGKG